MNPPDRENDHPAASSLCPIAIQGQCDPISPSRD